MADIDVDAAVELLRLEVANTNVAWSAVKVNVDALEIVLDALAESRSEEERLTDQWLDAECNSTKYYKRAEAAEAERDRLRGMLDHYTREYPLECNKRVAAEAKLARIAEFLRNADLRNHDQYSVHDAIARILNEGADA